MLDGVDQHFAVVVADHLVPLRSHPFFQLHAVGNVAVIGAINVGVASDIVWLSVFAGHYSEVAHLTCPLVGLHIHRIQSVPL